MVHSCASCYAGDSSYPAEQSAAAAAVSRCVVLAMVYDGKVCADERLTGVSSVPFVEHTIVHGEHTRKHAHFVLVFGGSARYAGKGIAL